MNFALTRNLSSRSVFREDRRRTVTDIMRPDWSEKIHTIQSEIEIASEDAVIAGIHNIVKAQPSQSISADVACMETTSQREGEVSALVEKILVVAQACTACMACELACGFHWTKKMDPSRSTIRVHRNGTTGLVDIQVLDDCNTCRGVETPLCVSVCAPRALSLGRKRSATAKEAP